MENKPLETLNPENDPLERITYIKGRMAELNILGIHYKKELIESAKAIPTDVTRITGYNLSYNDLIDRIEEHGEIVDAHCFILQKLENYTLEYKDLLKELNTLQPDEPEDTDFDDDDFEVEDLEDEDYKPQKPVPKPNPIFIFPK